MKKKPSLSVIMTVYNTDPAYLRQAVQSVINSDFEDLELIIIDDGSQVNTVTALKSFTGEMVRIFFQEHQGRANSLNSGIYHSLGKYIIFVDSDDFISGDYFSRLIAEASENPGFNYYYPEIMNLADKDGNITGQWQYDDFSADRQLLLPALFFRTGHSKIPFAGSLIKKTAFEKTGLFKNVTNVEDFVFLSRNLLNISFKRLNKQEGYYYRLHNSLSKQWESRSQNIADALYKMTELFQPEMLYPELKNIAENKKETVYYFYLIKVFMGLSKSYREYGEPFTAYISLFQKKLEELILKS